MAYDASTRALPRRAVIDIKGTRDDVLPRLRSLGLDIPQPGRLARSGELELLQAGPEHWLLLAPEPLEAQLLASQNPLPMATDTLVLAVSDCYQFLAVDGPHARDLLAIACPLDLDHSVFPADGATFTEAFGQKALLLRRGAGFELAFESSHGDYIQAYFSRVNPQP